MRVVKKVWSGTVEVQRSQTRQKQKEFYDKLSLLTPEDIQAAIPMVHPRTHPISPDITGIARFPIAQARAEGRPELTETGWMVLAQAIYRKNPTSLRFLEHIFDPSLSDDFLADSPDGMLAATTGAASSSGSRAP